MSNNQPTLNGLAVTIAQAAKVLTSYFESNGIPEPSFDEGSAPNYAASPEVIGARFQLLEALHDMELLVQGATDTLFLQPILRNHDNMILDILNQFNFFSAVPIGSSATYHDIASKTSLPVSLVRRILRHAFTARLFAEQPLGSGNVVHTAATAYATKTPNIRSWLAHNLEEVRPATFHVPDSLRRHALGKEKPSEEITESGFALADLDKTGTPTTYWDWLKNNPNGISQGFRASRLAEAMEMAAATSAISPLAVVSSGFDWNSLEDATVVDVGGSSGHDAIALARNFPKLKFIVQDLQEVEQSFRSNVPAELATRITFQTHDFFTPQQVKADIFFLKMVLHDWPDKYAIQILRNLLPALRAGGRIVLCEVVSPPTHDSEGNAVIPLPVRRVLSGADLQMFTFFNSLERIEGDWDVLLK